MPPLAHDPHKGPPMRTLLLSLCMLPIAFGSCKQKENAVDTSSTTEEARTPEPPVPPTPPATGPSTTSTQEPAAATSDSLVFKLQRTVCFGACPTYELLIYKSGYATYHGKQNVDRIGHYTTRVPQETIDKLIKEADAKGFFEMKPEYDRPVTDLPSTIISIQRNGDTKQVKGRVDIPQAFKDLAAYAEDVLFALPWQPAPGHQEH